MMRKIFIAAGIVFFVLAAVLLILRFQSSTSSTTPTPQKQEYKVTYKNHQISIPGKTGEILIKDIYTYPLQTLPNNGVFFAESDFYHMSFYPEGNYFLITLVNPNIVLARKAAEEDFLKQLEITQQQACELTVTVNIPKNVNEEFSGQDYGFSFCPGVISF